MKLFYWSIFIFFIKYSTSDFEYIPPSREMDVIEESDYTFGIKEDNTTNVTLCYYKTDTGISGSFIVKKEPPTTEPPPSEKEAAYYYEYLNFNQSDNIYEGSGQSDNGNIIWNESPNNNDVRFIHNEITDRGAGGVCEMTIKWVDDKGPTEWTLTPYNYTEVPENRKNLSEITYKINFFYKIKFLKPEISIYATESFYQYINMTDINFKSCILSFNNTKVDLSMTSTKVSSFLSPYSEGDEETLKRIVSFGHGLCGFKVINATTTESRKWTITATDDKGNRYRNSFSSAVNTFPDPKSRNTTQLVVLGDSTYVSCGDKYNQKFCNLYNPSGTLMATASTSDCSHSIPTVAMDDVGVWKCIAGKPLAMETLTYTVNVMLDNNVYEKQVEIWANEIDDKTFSIGCQIINYYNNLGISYCKLTAPNGQVIMPKPGGATGRYLSFGTDFTKGICRVEMPTPLQDYEKGRWQCEIFYGGSTSLGDFINVDTTDAPHYPTHSYITLQLKQEYQIQCQVPYSSAYCSIKAPNGTIYPTKSVSEPHVGRCSLQKMIVNVTDNGTWTCAFARGIGIPDEEIYVEVTIAEVFQYYHLAEVDAGNTAQLMCKSGGLPFKYCRFIAPNGTAYQINNHATSRSISYYGKGLEYGECGITIANAQTSDSGYWTCVTRIGSDFTQPEIKAEIMLEVTPSFFDDPNIGAAVGISVGVVVVTSIIVIVGVQKWRRRRHTEVPGSTVTPRPINNDDDNNSETLDIFSVAPVPRSYTNPQATVEEDWHAHQL